MQVTVRGKQIEIGPHPVGTRLKLRDACPALGTPDVFATVVAPLHRKGHDNGPTPDWSVVEFDGGGRLCAHTANLCAVA